MVLNLLDVVELLGNYPNQHEHHEKLELLRVRYVQSMLMNLRQVNLISGGLNVIHYF